jgi:hypothetical protein
VAGRLSYPEYRQRTGGRSRGFVAAGLLLLLGALTYGFLWVLSGLSVVTCTVRGDSGRCDRLGDMWPLAVALAMSVFTGFALLTAADADASVFRRRWTAGAAAVSAALLISVGVVYFPLAG